jgi:creatinine amidohydrolase/Fe(II)-dependent formamide hydrolase-like protein
MSDTDRIPSARRQAVVKFALVVLIASAFALSITGRPLTAPLPSTLRIADMSWVEVRSAIARGYTGVIVPSGGIEQNGPHMILGKHDHIVSFAAERIASELGQTLVAPVISFVPEGNYDPPTGHMRFPGTIGVSEEVYAGLLDGIARSLKAAGFKTISLIADHGGSAKAQAQVAQKLSREWAADNVRVISVDDYYGAAGEAQNKLLRAQGESMRSIGRHASIADTSELMAIHPEGVDLTRIARFPFRREPTGIEGNPRRATAERGRALIALKVEAAVRQIKAASAGMLVNAQ